MQFFLVPQAFENVLLIKYIFMKTKQVLAVFLISVLFLIGCNDNDDDNGPVTEIEDVISPEYPEAKQEVIDTFIDIANSINEGDMDKLIGFHAYGPKFTEFKNGELRNGSVDNEAHEREVFGAVTEVVKFEAKDLQVAVYGIVANVTFHSDFQLKFGEELVVVNDQITLLFVNTNNGWKMVHEHHSPLNY